MIPPSRSPWDPLPPIRCRDCFYQVTGCVLDAMLRPAETHANEKNHAMDGMAMVLESEMWHWRWPAFRQFWKRETDRLLSR